MVALAAIRGPRDLRGLSSADLDELAAEIRAFLVEHVSRTGGHLGPNLGVVELTLALHRVFDSPARPDLCATPATRPTCTRCSPAAHDFAELRQQGGLSGYPSRAESEHDVIENSHASTALSWADGLAKAYQLRGAADRHVVAVIGDGALTGGMAWEALNNIAAAKDRPLVIVVNDNERSYAPTIGGLAHHLATLRTTRGYERFLEWGKHGPAARTPVVGAPLYETLHGVKKGLKDIVAPQGMFEDLGLKYVGPIDGHDIEALEYALRRARALRRPGDRARHHPQGPRLPARRERRGRPLPRHRRRSTPRPACRWRASGPTWTAVFGDEMVAIGGRARRTSSAITAAMLHPGRPGRVRRARFPDRVFDVGIAEQHAATSAAGAGHRRAAPGGRGLRDLPQPGLRPGADGRRPAPCGVTFVLDRAGVTGDDGASHNGMWDLSLLQVVPGLRIAAPRDGGDAARGAARGRRGRRRARPSCASPRARSARDIPAVDRVGGMDVLRRERRAGRAARRRRRHGAGLPGGRRAPGGHRASASPSSTRAGSSRWTRRWPRLAARHRLVVTVEDNSRVGGVGCRGRAGPARRRRAHARCATSASRSEFLDHAKRAEVLAGSG